VLASSTTTTTLPLLAPDLAPLRGRFFTALPAPLIALSQDTLNYLDQRAAIYGGDASSMLQLTPSFLDSDSEVLAFWHQHELSHIQSQDERPDLADDWSNITPEDPSPNHSRGANAMTPWDLAHARLNAIVDAVIIDTTHHDSSEGAPC